MNRQDYNQQLVTLLSVLVGSYPELRFHQILQGFGFIKTMPDSNGNINWINEFYTEPEEILARVNAAKMTVDLSKPFDQNLTFKRLKELLDIKEKIHPITLVSLEYLEKKMILKEDLVHADERYVEEIYRLFLGGPHYERQK